MPPPVPSALTLPDELWRYLTDWIRPLAVAPTLAAVLADAHGTSADEVVAAAFVASRGADEAGRVIGQIETLLDDPDFPSDDVQHHARRYFATDAECRAWLAACAYDLRRAVSDGRA